MSFPSVEDRNRVRLYGELERLRNKLAVAKTALVSIVNIPLGPDRGSAQSQIDCAVSYASRALEEIRP